MPSPTRRRALQSLAATGSLLVAGCLGERTTPTPADERSPTDGAPTATPRTADGPWPMFGGDAGNRGYTRTGTGPGATATVAWRFDGGTPTLNASPVYVDGTVYTGASGDPGGIFAVDPETGEQRWGVEPAGYVTSAPAVVDDTLYVGTWGQRFYALDTADGTERWSVQLEHRFGEASPTVVGDTVYVATNGYGPLVVSGPDDEEQFEAAAIVAFDAATGNERWRYDAFGEKDRFSSSPAADANRVYIGAEDGKLYALDRQDGTVSWTRSIAGHPDPDPAVVDDTVYYASIYDDDDTPGRLWALASATGETRWSYDVADISIRTSPAIADDTVYLAASTTTACPAVGGDDSECESASSGTLYAVDRRTGEQRWTAALPADTRSSPVVADGYVYVGAGTGMTAVTTDGERAWQLDFRERSERDSVYIDSSPAVGDGRVFVGCSDGHLYGIEPSE